MFERRHVDLGQQSLRRDKGQSGGAPVPSLLAAGKPVHIAAADVARLQRAVGNRGIAALLTQQPDASIPPIQIQRCGEPGCDCVEDRTAPDLEVQRNGDAKPPALVRTHLLWWLRRQRRLEPSFPTSSGISPSAWAGRSCKI